MAASAWAVYDQAKLKLGQKLINLGTDVIKCALYTSASNVGSSSLATATYAAATNEVAQANGYTTGGVTVAATWVNAAGTETFDVADPTWTPNGGGIVARFAVLYDDTATNKDLLAWTLLDTTPADVNIQKITVDALGVFTLA